MKNKHSNFQSIVQSKARWLFTLFALLTLGIGQMWGASYPLIVNYPYVYLDNSSLTWSGCNVVVGHDTYSFGYLMSSVTGTKLFYKEIQNNWTDAKGIVFINATSEWGEYNNQSLWDRTNKQTRTGYQWDNDYEELNYHDTYLCTSTGSSNLSIDYKSGGYSDLNSTQTIYSVVKTGDGSYTSANSKATISISSYELTSHGTTTNRTPELSTSESSETVSAARTATTTLTVGDVASGYQFDGWYTDATGGTQLSSSTTYTYYPTAATTVYARFSEKMSTVTLTASPSEKGSFTIGGAAATSTTAGVTTTRSVTAVPASGYHFVSWSITGSASISSTTTNPTTVTGGGAGTAATLTATFAADDTYSLTVAAGTGISSVTGTTNDIKAAQDIAISATVATGYTWSTWTKTGDGTLSAFTAGTKDQTVTVGTAGDMTLTASATENMTTVTINSSPTGVGAFTLDAVAFTAGNTTTAGVATSHTVVATAANSDYAFSSWTAAGNATGSNSTNTYTLRGNGSGSTGTLTANFTLVPCKLYKLSAAKNGETTDKGAMSYDTDENAYYMDVTTDAQPFYFRFYHNGATQYGSTWEDAYSGGYTKGLQVSANGSKVLSDQNVNDWGDKPAMYYNGVSGSQIRIWFDYQNKKAWITTTDSQWAVSGGDSGSADGDDAMGDWSANANKMNESATNTVSTTINITSSGNYYLKVTDRYTNTWYGKNSTTITRASNSASGLISGGANITFTADVTGTYTFAYNTSTQTLTVTYPTETGYTVTTSASAGGSVDATSYTAYEFTTTAISATPNTGYYFTGWEATSGSGSVTFADPSSASTTINGVTAAATIKANFAPKWAVVGGNSASSDGSDEMGDWSTVANEIENVTTVDGKETGYVDITLAANTTYQFKLFNNSLSGTPAEKYYSYNGESQVMVYPTDDNNEWTLYTNNNNSRITTAGAGTYRFTWNSTDHKLTVDFPTSHTVTFGHGTGGTAETASGSVSGTITSGQYVAAGEDITFTQTPATGYTFKGWYTTAEGNTAVTGMGVSDPVLDDIAANASVYAQYTENMHTVTVLAGTHGTITTPIGGSGETVSAGIATSADIEAVVADYGYYFQGWTVESGTATIADASALRTTITATSDATIKANFVSHWTIAGGDSGEADGSDAMGDWSTVANGIDNFTEVEDDVWEGYADIDLPANTTFYFKVRDLYDGEAWYGNTGEMTYTNYENWSMTKNTANCRITTAGKGTYRFTWNEKNKTLTVTYPTSYTVAYSVYTFLGDDESNSESTTGGSISSVVDGDDIALTSGKYVVSDGTAVFTHSTPTTNYHFDGWYSDAACETAYVDGEGGAAIDDEDGTLTLSSLAADKTVYAKFAENMTTVTLASTAGGHIEIGSATVTSTTVGAVTTRSLTPVANTGYYFAGWTKTACTDYSISGSEDDEDNTTITLTGLGTGATSGETLTANFVELEKIYFRNIFDDGVNEPTSWENVYVYYNAYWDSGDKGAGAKERAYAQMTQIGSSNVYEAYIPRSVSTGGVTALAFSNVDFHEYNNFNGSMAVYRNDYNSQLNMFVPHHESNGTWNTTTYYSNGYWMQYDTKIGETAGYYLKKRTGNNTYSQLSQFEAITNHATTIQDTLRIDEMGTGNNKYLITSAGGLNYKAASQITSTNCMGIELVEDNNNDAYFEIAPSTEGDYVIQINQDGDKMKLNVIYPISVGDHRLKHTYTNGGTKSTYSDVIKSYEDTKKLSMYIDNTGSHSPSLKLQKCTALTAGVPTWSEGTAVAMTGIKSDTMGVYVFDLAVEGDAGTISDAAPYKGEYYIKADSLPGGWTNFKENVMILNTNTFDKNKPTTFDRYLCHWYGNRNNTYNTNIKCVVANEYCNQLSDTLFGDAVIGVGNQTLPYKANVRFSYNSTTNEVKRTYLNGSSDWQDQYLLLSGSTKLVDISKKSTFENNQTTFTDMNNWTYQKDVASYANSNVILTAQYNGQTQLLLGSTSNTDSVQLVGGTEGATAYNMRLVYDFKTDYLIAGYLAGNTNFAEDDAIYSDVLIIREEQGDAQQITFGEGKALTEVRTVYGVMQFNKSYINDESKPRYMRNTYWISFPFDVKLSDVVGFGSYGKQWIIQYYDGAARAANGLWIDSPSYWKRVTATERENGFTLKANVGYLLSLSLNNMSNSSNIWDNGVTQVALYFPSKEPVQTINGELPEAGAFTVPEHLCTIERDGRYYKDANWNIIGVPSYANLDRTVNAKTSISENDVDFLYDYNTSTNYMEVAAVGSGITFGAMKAYMVQYAGVINWRVQPLPAGLAAPRNAAEEGTYTLCLNINQDSKTLDKTYIRFNDAATAGLDMNKDLTKIMNGGTHNLYTLCEDIELGAQFLPVSDETVSIPVGIDVPNNGTVELAIPDGTDGLEVYLFDRTTGKHTNMLMSTYTVDLEKGTLNDRFVLEVRSSQMPTGIMSTGKVEEEVTKYMIDGHLYIKKGQRIYNAEGKLVNND